MKNKQFILVIIYSILSVLSIIANCTAPAPTAGGTSIGDAQVLGYVYVESGINLTPVQNAKVSFVMYGASPDTAEIITVITDETGLYKIEKTTPLSPGKYNIFAEKDNKKAYGEKVLDIQNTTTTETAPPIILSNTGSLTGRVLLQNPHTNDLSILLLIGTNLYFRPNIQGFFTLDSLAPGNYPVHIIAEPDGYKPYDTVFTIRADFSDTLTNPIILEYDPISDTSITGFTIDLDSALMVCRLSWNRLNDTIVKGYKIYCRNCDNNNVQVINNRIITDTFYMEDVVKKYSLWHAFKNLHSIYEYYVEAVDGNQNKTGFSKKIMINFTSMFEFVDSVFICNASNIEDWTFDRHSDRMFVLLRGNTLIRCNKDGSDFVKVDLNHIDTSLFLSKIMTDNGQNAFCMGPNNLIKLDSSFNLVSKLKPESDTTIFFDFDVNFNGELFVCLKGFTTVIKKYNKQCDLVTSLEMPILLEDYKVQALDNKLVIINTVSLYWEVVSYYDFDLTFLNSLDISESMKRFTKIETDTCDKDIDVYFEQQYNGYSTIQYVGDKLLVLSPQEEILARVSTGDRIYLGKSLDFYCFDGSLFTFRIKQ